MKLVLTALGSICLMLLLTASSQAKEWRGIIPLKSTRADVERLLGKPGAHGRYQFENERAVIDYAEGSCDKANNSRECLVSVDTVLTIYVTLEVEMRFSKLNLDRGNTQRLSIPKTVILPSTQMTWKASFTMYLNVMTI
jgi:hypothetical protein